jgi:hypothetical protein
MKWGVALQRQNPNLGAGGFVSWMSAAVLKKAIDIRGDSRYDGCYPD